MKRISKPKIAKLTEKVVNMCKDQTNSPILGWLEMKIRYQPWVNLWTNLNFGLEKTIK